MNVNFRSQSLVQPSLNKQANQTKNLSFKAVELTAQLLSPYPGNYSHEMRQLWAALPTMDCRRTNYFFDAKSGKFYEQHIITGLPEVNDKKGGLDETKFIKFINGNKDLIGWSAKKADEPKPYKKNPFDELKSFCQDFKNW